MHPSRSVPRSVLRIVLALSLLLGGLVGVIGISVSTASAVPLATGVLGGFQQDGDQVFVASGGGTLDWANLNPAPTPIIDPAGDSSIAGDENDPAGFTCKATGGDNPAKSDVLRAYVNPRIDSQTGHVFLDVAWVRASNNGSADVDYEFSQVGTSDPANNFTGACPLARTEGDLLLTYDFGGSNDGIRLWHWNVALDQWDEMTNIVANAAVNTLANVGGTGTIADPLTSAIATIPLEQFGEATVDLTAAFTPPGGQPTCATFAQTRVRSRSNGQSNFAALSDRLPAVSKTISTCGSITVQKKDDKGNLVQGATFETFKDNGDGIFQPNAGDGAAVGTCTTDAAGTCTIDDLLAGSYFVREVSAPVGYTAATNVVGPLALAANANVVINGTTDVNSPPDGNLDGFVNFRTQWQLTLLQNDTNLVNNNHTFVATLTKSTDGGATFVAAGSQTLNFSESGPGSVVSILPPAGLNQCTTDISGQCTITITSAATGQTLVTATFVEQGVTVTTRVTKTADATKNWVNFRLLLSPSSVNRAGTPHTFILTLQTDTGTGFVSAGAGKTIDLGVSGAGQVTAINGLAPVGPPFSCTTDASGQCTVTVNSAATGVLALNANYHAVVGDTMADFPATATKRWVDWQLVISPLTDSNLVGTNHTFTVTALFDAGDGAGPVPLPGVNPVVTLGGVGSLVTDTCLTVGTDVNGQCTVTITSAIPGASTASASLNDTELGVAATLSTPTATKQWVAFQLSVTPNGVNRVGSPHTFTVLLQTNSGNVPVPAAGETVDLTWSGDPSQIQTINSAAPGNAPFSCTTQANGTCTVVVNSAVTGTFSLDASYQAVVGSTQATIDADAATKRWVDWQLLISPLTATNPVGTQHTFIVTALFDAGDGAGPVALPDVHPVVTLGGVGSLVSDTCASTGTDANGHCTVTITSAVAGTSTANAHLDDTQSGVVAHLDAGPAQKLWVAPPPVYGHDPGDTDPGDPYGHDPGDTTPTNPYVPPTTPIVDPGSIVAGKTNPVEPVTEEVLAGETEQPAPATTPVGGFLPRTGAGIAGEATLALLLMVAGFALQLVRRRRSPQA